MSRWQRRAAPRENSSDNEWRDKATAAAREAFVKVVSQLLAKDKMRTIKSLTPHEVRVIVEETTAALVKVYAQQEQTELADKFLNDPLPDWML